MRTSHSGMTRPLTLASAASVEGGSPPGVSSVATFGSSLGRRPAAVGDRPARLLGPAPAGRQLAVDRQADGEAGAAAEGALQLDGAVVRLDDLARRRQAQSRPPLARREEGAED